jgi:hypothetical protein
MTTTKKQAKLLAKLDRMADLVATATRLVEAGQFDQAKALFSEMGCLLYASPCMSRLATEAK